MEEESEDFKKFLDKYGDVKVKFSSYYKYSFTFKGTLDNGNKLYCSIGGNTGDIYRLDVDTEPMELRDTYPDRCWIEDKKGKTIESVSEY